MPVTKAKASDATDAVIIKGPGTADLRVKPAGGPTSSPDPSLQESLEKGHDTQGNTVAAENANHAGSSSPPSPAPAAGQAGSPIPGAAPQGASETTGSASSPANTSAASSKSEPMAIQVTTITHTISDIPQDAETAMQRLKNDFTEAYHIVHNVGHYAALPVEDLGRLIAKMSTWMGVIRAAK